MGTAASLPGSGNWRFAHVDESSGIQSDGQRLYVMGAVLSTGEQEPVLKKVLREALLPGEDHLHWREEQPGRRLELAHLISGCELIGALVVAGVTDNRKQESARRAILTYLLPVLQHQETTDQVVIESRHQSDAHDKRTVNRLRQNRTITAHMHIDYLRKREDERLWIADALVGAFVGATIHHEEAPWAILGAAHCIEVCDL